MSYLGQETLYRSGALDGERGAEQTPLVHVLDDQPTLVCHDERHELGLMLWTWDGGVRADNGVALFGEGCAVGAFRRAHHDKRCDGRERRAGVGAWR